MTERRGQRSSKVGALPEPTRISEQIEHVSGSAMDAALAVTRWLQIQKMDDPTLVSMVSPLWVVRLAQVIEEALSESR
jgi:hypothetical protein